MERNLLGKVQENKNKIIIVITCITFLILASRDYNLKKYFGE